MAEPPEFWTFILSNVVTFGLGVVLTGLSYYAYRATGCSPSFRNATIGFGLVTLGMIVEPVYQLGFKGEYELGGRELLTIQTVEGVLLAIGFGVVCYSIYSHNSGRQQSHERIDNSD